MMGVERQQPLLLDTDRNQTLSPVKATADSDMNHLRAQAYHR
jgi:hypothetical protein